MYWNVFPLCTTLCPNALARPYLQMYCLIPLWLPTNTFTVPPLYMSKPFWSGLSGFIAKTSYGHRSDLLRYILGIGNIWSLTTTQRNNTAGEKMSGPTAYCLRCVVFADYYNFGYHFSRPWYYQHRAVLLQQYLMFADAQLGGEGIKQWNSQGRRITSHVRTLRTQSSFAHKDKKPKWGSIWLDLALG